jgi:tetratricopeptide (TPR) repeat protein
LTKDSSGSLRRLFKNHQNAPEALKCYRNIGWIVLTLIAGATELTVAQESRATRYLREEADQYYGAEQFHLAIEYYRELTDQEGADPALIYRLADCYRRTFNYPEAEAYYLKVHFLAPEQNPLALYYYALMLKFNANFDESIAYFDEFILRYKDNKQIREYVEQAMIDQAGCETAKEELGSPTIASKVNTLSFNSPYNDYAPAVRDSTTMVITSGRITSNRQSIDERYGEAFTDNFYYERQGGVWTDKTKLLFAATNTRYNDGSGCFNSSGNKYYFTVCGMDGPQCRLFVTARSASGWTPPVALNDNINFKSYESKHPAISNGGDTLVFSSDRPGGQGQFDLWMSVNSGGENWGPPMNLGASVNTKLNEVTPTFTAFPNVLFFGSDGHEGFGGIDLYMAKTLSTGETIIYSLGYPFNSNRDDCFVSFSDRTIYWSSNRIGGRGAFDIVSADIPSVISFISKLSLKKRNASRNINLKSKTEEVDRINLQASRLEEKIDYDKLTYEKRQIVDRLVQNRMLKATDDFGQFDLSREEFVQLQRIADQQYLESRLRHNGQLTRIEPPQDTMVDLSITGVLRDSVTSQPLASRKITLTTGSPEPLP